MIGAIAGDIIGSIYEKRSIQTKNFDLFVSNSFFTDDSVLTVAVADALMTDQDYTDKYKIYCRQFPDAGYGSNFLKWAFSSSTEPYYSYGNGAPMRVSPVAYAFNDLESVTQEAIRTAMPTHNHPEAIKGATAIASAIFLARTGATKAAIKNYIEQTFNYAINGSYLEALPTRISCQESVPQAFIAFLDSDSFEDAIRNAVYIGGDTDTLACMTGAIAEAYYGGVPPEIATQVYQKLDVKLLETINKFQKIYLNK